MPRRSKVSFDAKGFKLLKGNIRVLKDFVLTFGFQGPSGLQLYSTGATVNAVATFNEFGTKDIPARSFLRSTMFQEREKIQAIMSKAVAMVLNNLSGIPPIVVLMTQFSTAGAEIVRLIRLKIDRSKGWARRNAPSTISQKGFDFALHETELLFNSVSWAIRSGGSSGPIVRQGFST